MPRIEMTHNPDRATMAFDINAGPRAAISTIEIDADDPADRNAFAASDIAAGRSPTTRRPSTRSSRSTRRRCARRGFYEARATHNVDFGSGGAVVRVTIDRGPHVSVAFAGDPLPEADRERLVPIRAEGSADEDLLEDSNLAIEEYFQARGYRDADGDVHARRAARRADDPLHRHARPALRRRRGRDHRQHRARRRRSCADRPAEGRRSVRAGDARRRRRGHPRACTARAASRARW